MKWIAVILVMVNLLVFLLMKSYPDAVQPVAEGDFETINESAMSVLPPEAQPEPVMAEAAADTADLVEDDLAQLKLDDHGKVLMARNSETATDNKKDNKESNKQSAQSNAGATTAASAQQPDPEASTPVLKPLDRREKPATVAKASPARAETVAVTSEPVAKPVPAVIEAKACFRVGPFSNQKQFANVRRKLESANIEHSIEDKTAPGKIKAVRVYLGPFSDTVRIEAEKSRLSKMNIDHFVIVLNGERLIQLGYYSNPAGAKSVQEGLLARNVAAKVVTEYKDTRIENWLNIKSVSKADVDALGLPSGMSKKKDCR